MENIATIHERIKLLIDKYGNGKNTVFASLIDNNEANVRGYVKGVMPKYDALEKIVTNLDINANWLLTGRGEMCRAEETINDTSDTDTPTLTPMEERLLALLKEKDAKIEEQARLIGRLEAESEISNKKSDNSMDAGDATCVAAVG